MNGANKAMGLYKNDNFIDKVKGGLHIFSIMVTWGLENGIVTADSMSARGYGIGKRSRFVIFKWRSEDIIFLLTVLILSVLFVIGITINDLSFTWYPRIILPSSSPMTTGLYLVYAILVFIPTIINIKEALVWKSLQSKI